MFSYKLHWTYTLKCVTSSKSTIHFSKIGARENAPRPWCRPDVAKAASAANALKSPTHWALGYMWLLGSVAQRVLLESHVSLEVPRIYDSG